MIIGLDMGGTHIDGVIIKDGYVIKTIKYPTSEEHLWEALNELLSAYDRTQIKRINLSTTISTNAIVEKKTCPVTLVLQTGPGLPSDFLACGDENIFLSGSIDHRDEIVKKYHPHELRFNKEKNIYALAIVTKFSTRNPKVELAIKESLKDDFSNITMGHTISGRLNFPRRVYTSYLNSAVKKTFLNFSQNIKASLEKEKISPPVYILKADGGTMSLNQAEELPVESILSGPAASFMGINSMVKTKQDAILLDIGGTTTDIFFLADGLPLFEPLGIKISKYPSLVRAIYSISIGLGGDSSIDIENKKLKIGPERKGRPYALGGPKPTPTDAMIALGLIDSSNKDKACEGMKTLADKVSLSIDELSHLILEEMAEKIYQQVNLSINEINSKPVYTIKELLDGKILDPKSISLIGGPSKVLAPILEKKFKLPCKYPKHYQVANAIGAALARPTKEINLTIDTAKKSLTIPELGIYEKTNKDYRLEDGKKLALDLLENGEILEASSFNMVKGFYRSGRNIRIRAQVRPGLIEDLKGGIE